MEYSLFLLFYFFLKTDRMVGCMSSTSPFAHWLDHNGNCLSRGVSWDFGTNKKDRKRPLVT